MTIRSHETAEIIGRFYNKGLSYKRIAYRTGLNHLTVRQTINVMSAGFVSLSRYQIYLALQKGYSSMNEYQNYLAEQRGFSSINEYHKSLCAERQERTENRALSNLIKTRLEEIRKNQYWLSKQMGVSRQIISFYSSGKIIPSQIVLARLFKTLEVPYKRLEDILV